MTEHFAKLLDVGIGPHVLGLNSAGAGFFVRPVYNTNARTSQYPPLL
jgi:hypothetical protein